MEIKISNNAINDTYATNSVPEQIIEDVKEVKDAMPNETDISTQTEVPTSEAHPEIKSDTTTEPACAKSEPASVVKKIRTHVILMPNQLLPKQADIDALNAKSDVYVVARSMQKFYGVKSSSYISDEIIKEINKTVEPAAAANCISSIVEYATQCNRNYNCVYILLGVTPNNLSTQYQINADTVTLIIPAVALSDTIISYIDRVAKNIKRYQRWAKKGRGKTINYEPTYSLHTKVDAAYCERSVKDISARMEEFSKHITDCSSNVISVVVCTRARILHLLRNIINCDT